MTHKCETPPDKGEASRNSCGGCLRDSLTPVLVQAQFLMAMHHIRPEFAALVATLVFDGGVCHG